MFPSSFGGIIEKSLEILYYNENAKPSGGVRAIPGPAADWISEITGSGNLCILLCCVVNFKFKNTDMMFVFCSIVQSFEYLKLLIKQMSDSYIKTNIKKDVQIQ